jgi:3-dehydroquinate dehydratase
MNRLGIREPGIYGTTLKGELGQQIREYPCKHGFEVEIYYTIEGRGNGEISGRQFSLHRSE